MITDGGAGDLSLLPGQIVFGGTVGTFDVVVEIGVSKPILGSAAFPVMTLASSVTTTPFLHTALSTLTIKLTDTDFGPSASPLGFVSIFNSASPATQSSDLDTYIDLGNAAFGTTTPLSSLGPASGDFDLRDTEFAATDRSIFINDDRHGDARSRPRLIGVGCFYLCRSRACCIRRLERIDGTGWAGCISASCDRS